MCDSKPWILVIIHVASIDRWNLHWAHMWTYTWVWIQWKQLPGPHGCERVKQIGLEERQTCALECLCMLNQLTCEDISVGASERFTCYCTCMKAVWFVKVLFPLAGIFTPSGVICTGWVVNSVVMFAHQSSFCQLIRISHQVSRAGSNCKKINHLQLQLM